MRLNAANDIRKAIFNVLVYNFSNNIPVLSFEASPDFNSQKYVAITTIDEIDSLVKCKDKIFATYEVTLICMYKYLQKSASYVELENIAETVISSLADVKLTLSSNFICIENKYLSANQEVSDDGKGVVVKKTLRFRVQTMQDM